MAQQLAQRVTVLDMPDFMQQHGGDFVIVVGDADQFIGDHDAAVRQRDGIRPQHAAAAELEAVNQLGCRRQQRRKSRFEGRASRSV